jgi:hypothetical protein
MKVKSEERTQDPSLDKAREGILSFVRLLAENDALEHSKTHPGTEG